MFYLVFEIKQGGGRTDVTRAARTVRAAINSALFSFITYETFAGIHALRLRPLASIPISPARPRANFVYCGIGGELTSIFVTALLSITGADLQRVNCELTPNS